MAISRPFTPRRESAETLKARTVGRERQLAALSRTLRSAATSGNRNHTLLIGPRGSGKSHLIAVALGEIAADKTLSSRLFVVEIPEDTIGFVSVRRIVDHQHLKVTGQQPDPASSLAAVQQSLHDSLAGRVLVMVIENLDRVMRALGDGGQRDLRSWVETSGDVLLLASTPLLFPGVQKRDKPWYSAFANVWVEPLTPDEGQSLLRCLAEERGDSATLVFLDSKAGRARVRALAALTGGSPRAWTILFECLTPATLDALLPVVQQLLEDLVPYYQQLLWDLPSDAQVVVDALCTGASAGLTVGEIVSATQLAQARVSAILRALTNDRWVTASKAEGADQRRTWYQLREPLLRHHVQYRSGDSRTLTLIVEILRGFYGSGERRRLLIDAPMATPTFEHVAAPFVELRASDSGYSHRDLTEMRAEARLWVAEGGTRVVAGEAIDQLVRGSSDPDDFGERVRNAAEATDGPGAGWLELVDACWNGRKDPERASRVMQRLTGSPDPRLALAARGEYPFWVGECGEHQTARDLYADLITDRTRVLGADHPSTLTTRSNHAYLAGECGDHQAASQLFDALQIDSTRVLGPDHPSTRGRRLSAARSLERAGHPDEAWAILTELLGSGLEYGVFVSALELVRRHPETQIPEAVPVLTRNLLAAAAGSSEARLRLPAELLPLIDSLGSGDG